jgi:uncharacterized protein YecT (DUF1311 family)
MIRRYLIAIALAVPTTLGAQDSLRVACDSAMTTIDMRRCASRDLESAQRDLERYLQEARRVAANRGQLDSSQAAWVRYRDVACRAAASEYEGGTMQPLVVLGCLRDLTRDRIRQVYNAHLRTSDTILPEPKG